MRVLVVGSGGREHALAWKIAASAMVEHVYCAPGNAGTARCAENVAIAATDITALADFAAVNKVDLTVVGPEVPLMAGIVDLFEGRGLRVFGPSRDPARIEGSKAFAKDVMHKSNIPTAEFWVCDTPAAALDRLAQYFSEPRSVGGVVIKADGLAAGKGVTVCDTRQQAEQAIESIMVQRVFGDAGNQVVIEERLTGPEASVMVITDGHTIVPLLPAQDHKRLLDHDEGPNTGGMGAYCPVKDLKSRDVEQIIQSIVRPAIDTIRELGIPYRGALYAGIMLTPTGPKCIEFNCRFGDPETQAVLPMLKSDLVPILLAALDGNLADARVEWYDGASVSIVAASGGYPGSFKRGVPIEGLEEAAQSAGCIVFHGGTRVSGNEVVTDGGRVLAVTARAADFYAARAAAYAGISKISYQDMHYRTDIASGAAQLQTQLTSGVD